MAQQQSPMIEKFIDSIPERVLNFFIQVVLVALVAMSIKIAIQMKKEKVTLMNIILSFIIGMGFAVLTGNLVMEKFSPTWAPLVIATITLIAEKVGFWLLYKFNVDSVMEDVVLYLSKKLKK
jgi:uncharacterized membrane protein